MIKITKEILIEDLVENFPFSVEYLSKNGIRCIRCGEAIWGTLEEAALEKGFDEVKIEVFVKDLNSINDKFEKEINQNVKKIDVNKI